MIYVLMRREISKYLVTKISCDYLFDKINNLNENEIRLDFTLVYYISNEFMEEYKINKNNCKKNITEVNMPLNFKNFIYN
jgi:hypothetical protein